MGRAPCCSKVGLHRGPWTAREDALLASYIQSQGEGNWRSLPKKAGLLRCGKSCRLRWMNYLRPDIKRGNIGPEEEDLIIRLHYLLGNRWSLIAGRLPGRTDNEIKNYWNSHLSKKLKNQGLILKQGAQGSKRARASDKSKMKKKNNNILITSSATGTATDDGEAEGDKSETHNRNGVKIYAPKPTRFATRLMEGGEESGLGFEKRMEEKFGSDVSCHEEEEEDLQVDFLCSTADLLLDPKDIDLVEQKDGFSMEDAVDLERLYCEYSQLLQSEEDHNHMMNQFIYC